MQTLKDCQDSLRLFEDVNGELTELYTGLRYYTCTKIVNIFNNDNWQNTSLARPTYCRNVNFRIPVMLNEQGFEQLL